MAFAKGSGATEKIIFDVTRHKAHLAAASLLRKGLIIGMSDAAKSD